MKYLARTADGRPLLGDDAGYVPLEAAAPALESVRDALPRAAAGTPGAEPIAAGDEVRADVERIGSVAAPVVR